MWGDKMTASRKTCLRRCTKCNRESMSSLFLCSPYLEGCNGVMEDVTNRERKRNVRTLGDLDR